MDKKLYKFGMDWLNGVLPVSDVQAVFDLLAQFSSKLRFDRWVLTNSGMYNYSRRFMLDGKATLQLMYNPLSDEELFTANMEHNNSGIFFSISGDGIRYLHSLGGDVSALNKLLFYFYRHGFRSSRFDVYCDILDERNEIVPLITEAFSYARCEQVGKPFVVTRLRRSNENFKQISVVDDNGNKWYNSQLGHHGSSVGMFRCYNKYIEMSEGRLSDMSEDIFKGYDVDEYWYRLEYEMHKDNAAACFDALMQRADSCNSPLCFEDIFFSVFDRVFSIGVASCVSQFTDGHCKIPEAWLCFSNELCSSNEYFVQFGGVPYIKVSLKRIGKNAERISGYFYAINQYLTTLSPEERRRFLKLAKDKYDSQPRYNILRDEISEFNESMSSLHSKAEPLTWQQVDFDIPAFV